MIAPYPWQAELWQRLSGQLREGRLGHALLLQGRPGLGQDDFAQHFARAFLCHGADQLRPCGQCKSCCLFEADGHPDFQRIEAEGAGKAIKVGQIRELLTSLEQTPQQGRGKCVILSPADAMNASAANALLKSLEEPQGRTLMMLVTSSPSRLPATIRSRCQSYAFPEPRREQALEWLKGRVGDQADVLLARCQGAPLEALAWFRDDRIAQEEAMAEALVGLAEGRLSALEAAKVMMEAADPIGVDHLLHTLHAAALAPYQAGERGWLQQTLAQARRDLVFRFADKVTQVKSLLLSSANPNRQLLWEELMLDWSTLLRRSDNRTRIPV